MKDLLKFLLIANLINNLNLIPIRISKRNIFLKNKIQNNELIPRKFENLRKLEESKGDIAILQLFI